MQTYGCSVGVCMCVWMYIWMYVCLYVCMFMYVYMDMYMHIHMRIYSCTYVCMCVCMCVRMYVVYVHIYIYIHMYIYIYMILRCSACFPRPAPHVSSGIWVCARVLSWHPHRSLFWPVSVRPAAISALPSYAYLPEIVPKGILAALHL